MFAFATDPENVLLYSSNLTAYERVTEGPIGKGAHNRGSGKVAGKRIEFLEEVVEFEEGRRLASSSVESPVPYELDVIFEDADGGTRVSWHQESPGFGGFFGKLTDPLVTRMYAKDVRSNLEKLKELLEGA